MVMQGVIIPFKGIIYYPLFQELNPSKSHLKDLGIDNPGGYTYLKRGGGLLNQRVRGYINGNQISCGGGKDGGVSEGNILMLVFCNLRATFCSDFFSKRFVIY